MRFVKKKIVLLDVTSSLLTSALLYHPYVIGSVSARYRITEGKCERHMHSGRMTGFLTAHRSLAQHLNLTTTVDRAPQVTMCITFVAGLRLRIPFCDSTVPETSPESELQLVNWFSVGSGVRKAPFSALTVLTSHSCAVPCNPSVFDLHPFNCVTKLDCYSYRILKGGQGAWDHGD
jgi:hypothetical protein